MSDLEVIRESISELNNSSKEFLISALIEADAELSRAENSRNEWQEVTRSASDRADLHQRRCQIALAVLRDDEAGLTYTRLDQLADIIWPEPVDPTQQPTPPKSHIENELAELLHTAVVSFRELQKILPAEASRHLLECSNCGDSETHIINPPFELGGLKQQIESFQLRAKELLNKLYGRFFD